MKRKNIIAFLTAFVLLFTAVSFNAAAADEAKTVESANPEMSRVLTSLGIIESIGTDFVTRADFVKAVAALVNLSDLTYVGDMPYGDVLPENDAYGSIGNFYKLGILSSAASFEPDRVVTEYEAAKILVSALGYEELAKSLGGYPYGYVAVLGNIDIKNVFDGDGMVSSAEMVEALYEALDAEVRHTNLNGETIANNVPLLETYHKLTKLEGQVTATKQSGLMNENDKTTKGYIMVEDKLLDVEGCEELEVMLGYRVSVYISSENKNDKTVYAYEASDNKIARILAEDAEVDLSALKIKSEDKSYKLSRDYQIIYNGVADYGFTDAELTFSDGKYELVDSNSDGLYDVVHVWRAEYIVVDKFTYDGSIVTDVNNNTYGSLNTKVLSFKEDDDVICDFVMFDGLVETECTVGELSESTGLAVYISRSGKYIKAEALLNTISGSVDSVGEDNIEIAGVSYPLTYYAKAMGIKPNSAKMNALLTNDGKLVALINEKSEMKYGYIMQLARSQGLDSSYQIMMLCENGDKKIFKLKSTLTLDGKSSADTETAIANGDIENYMLVRYRANSDDIIIMLDTPSPVSDDLSYGNKDLDDRDSLRLYISDWFRYYSGIKQLNARYALQSPVIFDVPTRLNLDPDKLGDRDSYSFNKDDFNLGSVNSFGTYVDASVYDVTEDGDCGVLVRYIDNNPNAVLTDLEVSSQLGVVDKVTMAVNGDGNAVPCVTIANTNGFKKYNFSTLLSKKNRTVAPGDIVRYAVIGNEISNLEVTFSRADFDVTEDFKGKYRIEPHATLHYHVGTIYNITSSHIVVDDPDTQDNNQYGLTSGHRVVFPYSSSVVLKYDKAADEITIIDKADILTSCDVGEDKAYKAVGITYQTEKLQLFVVYEQ